MCFEDDPPHIISCPGRTKQVVSNNPVVLLAKSFQNIRKSEAHGTRQM